MNIVREVREKADDAARVANKVDIPMTRRLGLFDFVKRVFKEMSEDHLGAFAGNLAYSTIFALFPFMLFIVSILGVVHADTLVTNAIDQAKTAMPGGAGKLLDTIKTQVLNSQHTSAYSISAVISILAALYGASGGFRAVMEAMNVMYEVEDKRPFWKRYLISIGLALVSSGLLISAAVLAIAGPRIGGAVADAVGLGAVFQWTWNILQWPVLLVFVALAFAIIYYMAPDVEQKFRFISPGALIAVGLWVVFSLVFSLYVNNFGSYNKTYGTLAGIAIFLLYIYYSAFILLLGAEMNQVIEEHAPGGKKEGQKTSSGNGGTGSTKDDTRGNRTLEILEANRPAEQAATR
jgi:membrane protein